MGKRKDKFTTPGADQDYRFDMVERDRGYYIRQQGEADYESAYERAKKLKAAGKTDDEIRTLAMPDLPEVIQPRVPEVVSHADKQTERQQTTRSIARDAIDDALAGRPASYDASKY